MHAVVFLRQSRSLLLAGEAAGGKWPPRTLRESLENPNQF